MEQNDLNGFQQAVAAAEAEAGKHRWPEMSPAEQTRKIYAQLRRIDAQRAEVMAFHPGVRGRYRAAKGAAGAADRA